MSFEVEFKITESLKAVDGILDGLFDELLRLSKMMTPAMSKKTIITTRTLIKVFFLRLFSSLA
jgi:hypothetical protein